MIAELAVFVLMVTIGSQPSYERGKYYSYSSCVSAAQAEVETLPEYRDRGGHWVCLFEQSDHFKASPGHIDEE